MDIPKGNCEENLIYKNTKERDIMLTFLPPSVKKYEKAPLYFIIPGGGWVLETRQSMIEFSQKSVDALRNEGFAVVSIDYRVTQEGAVMRDIITDCFDAARYVSHYADVFGIDRDEFYVSGHSAGGHLALMLSYGNTSDFCDGYEFCDTFTVKATAPMSPPTVLFDNRTHNLAYELGLAFNNCDTEEERKKSSPVSYVSEKSPATLLMAGTSDYLVFSLSSQRLFEMLKDAGVKCNLILSLGGGHCFEKIHDGIEPSVTMDEIQGLITHFILGVYKK